MLQYKVDKESIGILGDELWKKPLDLQLPADSYIIDLGGNTGKFAKQIKSKTNTIVSIDIERAIMVGGDGKPLPGIEPIQGNILYLPFKDNTFDVVLARAILHHVPDNLDLAFKEIYRILKPGGQVIVEEPGALNPIAYIIRNAFPTSSHEESERPFKPSVLKEKTKMYFTITKIEYHWLLSYSLPHFISRLPKKLKPITRKLLGMLVRMDNVLLKYKTFQPLCGYLYIKGKVNKE
jgi:ubiquinone/menaquinone biosynthesis C-methylase UbiE